MVDVLHRFAAGLDLRDRDLLASAFAVDAVSDFGPAGKKAGFEFPVLHGRENIVARLANSFSLVDTTHSITNAWVDLDGDKAHLDALVEAQHLPANNHSSHYLMRSRYDVEPVR